MVDEDKDQRTADPGSDPGTEHGKVAGAEPAKKEGASDTPSPEGEKLPFDQHPKWKAARAAEKSLQEIMTANELESLEDLVQLVVTGKELKGKQIDVDQLDTLLKKAQTLERYELYWKEQEEQKRRSEEDPTQTIARLEKQLKDLSEGQRGKEQQAQKAQEAKKLWESYDSEVTKIFETIEDIPPEARKFYTFFMGVNNPASNVDFTDKKAIKQAAAEARKIVDDLMEYAIKQYVDGKRKIPTVPGSAGTPSVSPKIKNLREARKIMLEQASKFPR